MKKLLSFALAVAVLGGCLNHEIPSAQTFGTNPVVTVQDLTGSAPTLASQGLPLEGLASVRVILSANSAQTLSGAGTLQGYLYDRSIARWARYPQADLTANTASVRDLAFDSKNLGVASGKIHWVPSGITVSGGTTVNLSIQGYSVGPRGK